MAYFNLKRRKRLNQHEQLESNIVDRAKRELMLCSADQEVDIISDTVLKIRLIRSHRYLNPLTHHHPKSTDWLTAVVPHYDDRKFRATYRVDRAAFMYILRKIENDEVFKSRRRPQLPVVLQLAIVLSRLGHFGNKASYIDVAKDFGVSDGGSIKDSTTRVLKPLLKEEKNAIVWPDQAKRDVISNAMARHGFPFCVGFADGTHIKLQIAPKDDAKSYFNRKSFYSIQAQLTCDHEKRIIHAVVGYPGCVHDAKVFRECALAKNPDNFFSGHEYIIGDGAYKLETYVVTPYRKITGQTQPDIDKFNHLKSKDANRACQRCLKVKISKFIWTSAHD